MRSSFFGCVLLVVVSSCTSCEKKSEPAVQSSPSVPAVALTTGTPSQFWSWFAASEVALADAVVGEEPMDPMNAINEKLKLFSSGMVAEVAINREPGAMHTLVISADGRATLFPSVRALVAEAPSLTRFKALAFRPRRSGDSELNINGKTFAMADFFYRELGRSEGKLDVEVLVKGLTPATTEGATQAISLMLDGALGEFDAEAKLGEIRIAVLPAELPVNAKPLNEIAKAVDSL